MGHVYGDASGRIDGGDALAHQKVVNGPRPVVPNRCYGGPHGVPLPRLMDGHARPGPHRSPQGNPNWWSLNNSSSNNNNSGFRGPTQQPSLPALFPSSSPSSSSSGSSIFNQYAPQLNSLPMMPWQDNQELPESWSQLLLGGLVGEEAKKMESWEEQVFHPHQIQQAVHVQDHVKQERSECGSYVNYNGQGLHQEDHQFTSPRSAWTAQVLPVSSPRSCITSFSSNMLDFSNNNSNNNNKFEAKHTQPDHSSEVRKEKLGDRITALHQLVSPFGKTDTASVLLEAIGYIRFLQSQIEALSSPYLGSGNLGNMKQHAQGDRNCLFPEDPGQLLNEACMKRKGASEQDGEAEPKKDLKSRGLCLMPISFTIHVGSDNGADYWAPAIGGGFR
ncbi:Transcription factor bHLH68 [Acorus calamus]|uniref:Transcription factor bHLH68 n=1 Tax=Acorus calamus TaxID=4465 RepID=A0AAV9CCD1_ACOCL|nr:Transcription factor bHLH68 [Acorus calamus]